MSPRNRVRFAAGRGSVLSRRRRDSWDTSDTDSGKSPYESNKGKFPGSVSQPSQLSTKGSGSRRRRRPSKNRAKTLLTYAHRLDLDALRRDGLFDLQPGHAIMNKTRLPCGDQSQVACLYGSASDSGTVLFLSWPPNLLSQTIHAAVIDWPNEKGRGRPFFRCLYPTSQGVCLRPARVLYKSPTSPLVGCRACALRSFPAPDHVAGNRIRQLGPARDRKHREAGWESLPSARKIDLLCRALAELNDFLKIQSQIAIACRGGTSRNASKARAGARPNNPDPNSR